MATVDTQRPQEALPSEPEAPSGSLTPSQIDIIKATVPVLVQHGETITVRFYKNLFTDHPSLKNIFNTSNMANGRQPRALAGALYAYAANIDNLGALTSTVKLIAHRHASLFVQPEHYEVVGKYLLAAMQEILGSELTPDILEAWKTAYWQLANIFIATEKELYAQAGSWQSWTPFTIAKKEKESDEVTSFYLEPAQPTLRPLPDFLPGQYISIRTTVPSLQHLQPRQYSLSDAPNGKYYRISIKREMGLDTGAPEAEKHEGDFSNMMHDTKSAGDVVDVSHPYGDFYYDAKKEGDSAPLVLLSAGVGLTCLTSIFNTATLQSSSRPISFIHGARSSAVRAFGDHVRSIAAEKPDVNVVFFTKNVSDEDQESVHYHHKGRLDLSKLEKEKDLFVGNEKTQYFVCGPEAFMNDVQAGLKGMGVEGERIHCEAFGPGGVAS